MGVSSQKFSVIPMPVETANIGQVFGNSNSLPISLVLSLSKTIKGLHWDKIANDNDNEVAARGILYLLIFQQLGQLLRWSWGYNVLLAPPKDLEEEQNNWLERGQGSYTDEPNDEIEHLVDVISTNGEEEEQNVSNGSSETNVDDRVTSKGSPAGSHSEQDFVSGEQTPVTHQHYASSVSSKASSKAGFAKFRSAPGVLPTPANGNVLPSESNNPSLATHPENEHAPDGSRAVHNQFQLALNGRIHAVSHYLSVHATSAFGALPRPIRKVLTNIYSGLRRFLIGLWSFMNPPLWAMLAAIVVAAIPSLQSLFFSEGTFVKNSITSAISQSAGVAVPLILVVLGANLARNTLPKEAIALEDDDRKEETKLLIAALVSRMLLPTIIMTPILALTAKYTPISILEDPIFVIVCFLLTGAPSALQLAQICQINNVYMGTITRLLFQSYVVWFVNPIHNSGRVIANSFRILPSTLILVMLALEVVEWAQA